jgi:hypothetical protein
MRKSAWVSECSTKSISTPSYQDSGSHHDPIIESENKTIPNSTYQKEENFRMG